MAQTTGISWTDATWNPVAGCSVISAGCKNCYAMKMAHRFASTPTYEGTTHVINNKAVWTGKVNLIHTALDKPLHWKKPRKIFVNSMSDLFHEDVPDDFILKVWDVMRRCPHHTFQILTKRAGRMERTLNEADFPKLRNVWLGVSIENRNQSHYRLPCLNNTPAHFRFISFEPLLEDVSDLYYRSRNDPFLMIDWIIIGGESGPNARPMDPQWARNLLVDCRASKHNIPVWFKQMGGRGKDKGGDLLDGERIQEFPDS